MRKRTRDIALLLLATALVIGIVLHQHMTQQAQQARDATLATLEVPEQVRFYQDLAANAPKPTDHASPTPPTTALSPETPYASPHAIMAHWADLFEEASKWIDDDLIFSAFWVFEPDEEPS